MALEKIDYTKLSTRGLKDLINQHDDQALEEYTKRVMDGKVKVKTYKNIDELEKEWNKKKKAS